MPVRTACLVRQGNYPTLKVISLHDKEELDFGRSEQATVTLLSLTISRRHASLKKIEGKWTITDHSSQNGIFVNHNKIQPETAIVLENEDVIQLGCPISAEDSPEFVWKFFTSRNVKILKDEMRQENYEKLTRPKLRRLTSLNTTHAADAEWSPSYDAEDHLANQRMEQVKLLEEQRKQLEELQSKLAETEEEKNIMKKDLKKKEKEMKEKLDEMKEKSEAKINLLEKQLKSKMGKQKESLIADRDELLKRQQKNLESKLQEKDLELQKELKRLDKVINEKEAKEKMLECQLKEAENRKERHESSALQAREAVLGNFSDVMDSELQCSICTELFIQATTLNCSHVFCALCIDEWKKIKKKCPICRVTISTAVRSLVLDNFIDKMVEHFNDDLKESRKKLVEERRATTSRTSASGSSTSTARRGRGTPRGRGQARAARGGRGTARGGRRTASGRATAASGPGSISQMHTPNNVIVITGRDTASSGRGRMSQTPTSSDVIVISDTPEVSRTRQGVVIVADDEAINLDSDSGSSEEEGLPGVYYGGYGRCSLCHRRGHWITGCPLA